MNRPLYSILVEPEEKLLNSCLEATRKLYQSETCVSEGLVELVEQCIRCPQKIYKVYALLSLMLICPPIRQFFGRGEDPARFNLFMSVLQVSADYFLTGKKPDGGMYSDTDDLSMGQPPYFVHRMVQFYANES
jgi:hypothetical protein